MRTTIALLALALNPLLALAQSTTVKVPASIPTTIVPFSTLPLCAQACGPLQDAQGACAGSGLTSSSTSCFCAFQALSPFYTSTLGVCNDACSGSISGYPAEPNGLMAIQAWFSTFCKSSQATTTAAAGGGQSTSTSSSSASTSTVASGGSSSSAGGTWYVIFLSWPQGRTHVSPNHAFYFNALNYIPSDSANISTFRLDTHKQWVAMIVVVFFGIAGIWIGAWLLRRRYLKKHDKSFEMKPPAAWGPSQTQSGIAAIYGDGILDDKKVRGKGKDVESHGVREMAPAGKRVSKIEKKRWNPMQRT